MFRAIKPLGLMLARLPVGADHPDATKEPTSAPYRASFLLPHYCAAWPGTPNAELATFAANLHPPAAEHTTAAVSDALSRTASHLMTHLEAG